MDLGYFYYLLWAVCHVVIFACGSVAPLSLSNGLERSSVACLLLLVVENSFFVFTIVFSYI